MNNPNFDEIEKNLELENKKKTKRKKPKMKVSGASVKKLSKIIKKIK